MYVCISTYTLGGSEGMLPQEILIFGLGDCFWCILGGCFSGFIKGFWEKLFSTDVVETGIERLIVAISRGGARFDQGGASAPPPST